MDALTNGKLVELIKEKIWANFVMFPMKRTAALRIA